MSWLSAVRRGWHSLCDVLEIELAIVTKDKSSQRYQQLSEWWVHIDKVLRFDVFRGKFSEMDLVKAAPVRVRYILTTNKDLHNAIRLGQSEQAHTRCNQDDQEQQFPLPRRHIQSSRWITRRSARTKAFRRSSSTGVRIEVSFPRMWKSL